MGNSVLLIYHVLSNCSVFTHSTYSLDYHNILVDIVPQENLFEIIDLVYVVASVAIHGNLITQLTN